MAVDIPTDPELDAGIPRLLLEERFNAFGSLFRCHTGGANWLATAVTRAELVPLDPFLDCR